MLNKIEAITKLEAALNSAKDWQAAVEIKNKWHKENITALQISLKNQTPENKKTLGIVINELKHVSEELLAKIKNDFEAKEFITLQYDNSVENFNLFNNQSHWLNNVVALACDWFVQMNFQIEQGNEIVTQVENFDLLNIDLNHPARLGFDSFYYNSEYMLRAHNTSNTARVLKDQKIKKDLRVATFGNVYRNDADDATHSHQFMQIDFIWVQKKLSLANLKWVINHFLEHVFEAKLKTRFRLSFFPFTEPSFEVDLACPQCAQKGCVICKKTGWIEVLGSGMIHPNVLRNTGYDPSKYNAIAAGIGCERLAMIKHQISDIRKFYANDERFFKREF